MSSPIKDQDAATESPALTSSSAAQLQPKPQSVSIDLSTPQTSPGPQTPKSVTSKEWVIPPRPKPGRKPATDMPPTKRKAQNRAAQRAFRERRAARVGELEEHIRAIEGEDEREQRELKAQIEKLNRTIEQYRSKMNTWMHRSNTLQKELAEERKANASLLEEVHTLRYGKINSSESFMTNPAVTKNPASEYVSMEPAPLGCGGCSSTSSCECIDAALDMSNTGVKTTQTLKRPHSPQRVDMDKRVKAEPLDDSLETDFTHSFPKSNQPRDPVSPSSMLADPCGFCQNGTPCICAELSTTEKTDAVAHPAHDRATRSMVASSVQDLSHFTPPPDGDVPTQSTTRERNISSDLCLNGAGTCAQCQSDPNSTLFCKALAASRARSLGETSRPSVGCCGRSQSGQSCCRSQSGTIAQSSFQSRSNPSDGSDPQLDGQSPGSSVTLTCADAFTTLSRHPNYERAITSGDVGSWMPKLYASPSQHSRGELEHLNTKRDVGIPTHPRPAMEIEVANVMSVLRDFDRRFGTNA